MTTTTRIGTILAALSPALLVACVAEDAGPEPAPELTEEVELLDPCTGEVIGVRTAETMELLDGTVIDLATVDRDELELPEMDAMIDEVCAEAFDDDGVPKTASATVIGACVFWEIFEENRDGSYGCSGFCCGGNGTYYCSESCYDFSHT